MSHLVENSFPHKLGRKFIGIETFRGYLEDGTSGITVSLGAGGAKLTEGATAAAELSGLPMDTGDEVYHRIHIPTELWDADLSQDILAKVHCENKKAGAVASVDFTLHFKGQSLAQVAPDAKSSADATVTFPATGTSAVGLPFSTVAQALGAPGVFAADEYLCMALTLADKGDAAADEVVVTGVELQYTRQILDADGIGKRT